jgi:hypothetical protein
MMIIDAQLGIPAPNCEEPYADYALTQDQSSSAGSTSGQTRVRNDGVRTREREAAKRLADALERLYNALPKQLVISLRMRPSYPRNSRMGGYSRAQVCEIAAILFE